eukprot:TRINITY_DN18734_c0_g1_i3.p1 TRINITY_DN18734_c0_g1~~TRINITY_DN18734_c0_g1_i3.p1  ORF type:complete len:334 (+),score=29.94 TRINITY_DN18734_c0_g1_i3:487-1488(+)
MQELKMNVPQLPSLFGREQEQLQVESQYSNLPFMNSPGVNDAIPSPLSTFPIKPVAPFKQDWTSVLDYESMLLESSRTYSARSNASRMSQDSVANRAPSPSSVLNELRGSLMYEGASGGKQGPQPSPQVLTAKGIADLGTPVNQQTGADADLVQAVNLLNLLQQYQQVQQEMPINNPLYMQGIPMQSVVVDEVYQNGQPVPHSIDIMQQMLCNPAGNHLYKTELCRAYDETKKCRFGDRCKYAHGEEELRPLIRGQTYKTKICKSFVEDGYCPYGSRCNFVHKRPASAVKVNVSKITPQPSVSSSSSPLNSARSTSSGRLPIFLQLTEWASFE